MGLSLRLLRALWIFGLIFASYMLHLGFLKMFRTWERDPETGREVERMPDWLRKRRKRVDSRNAKRLLNGMLKLRGVYIKLGQVLSIMGGFLPRVYSKELEALQDQVPPHPFSAVEATFFESLKKKPQDCFKSIDPTPLAAASLGQVHVAYLKDGTKVAVKVLYPNIRDVIRVDMRVVRLAINVYKQFYPVQNVDYVHDALVDMLRRETDYMHEADCMARMSELFKDEEDILVPLPVREFTSSDVLTMTFMEGIKITRFDELAAANIDRTAVATRLIQSFYKQLFLFRFFHADPHPGNFLVQAGESPDKPKIVILDFGAICEARESLLDGLLDIVQATFTQNHDNVLSGFRKMGFVAADANEALVDRTILTYFNKLLKIQDRTPGALMKANQKELEQLADPEIERAELRELMRSIHYPEDWFYVERACVMVFWLCGQIDPDLDTMQVGLPYILPLMMERSAKYQEAEQAPT